MDYIVHGILQDRILEWVAFPFSPDLPNPGMEPRSATLQVDSLPTEPQGKPFRPLSWSNYCMIQRTGIQYGWGHLSSLPLSPTLLPSCLSGLQVFCLFFSVSREPCRDHFRITECQAPRFSSCAWPSKVLRHSREIECTCLPLWWLVKLSLGRHICRWACSDWRTPLPDPNSPRGITFTVLLCPGELVLHTFATSILCTFTHTCHQPPPRPSTPTSTTSAFSSLGPYFLLSAGRQP